MAGWTAYPPLLELNWAHVGNLCSQSNQFCPSRTILWCSKALRARFFRFFVDFDAPRTFNIIEKPQENLGFSMVFILSAKLLPNQKNKALEHAGTFKMEVRAASNGSPSYQNDSRKLQYEAQERQVVSKSAPMAAQRGHGSPTCCYKCSQKQI